VGIRKTLLKSVVLILSCLNVTALGCNTSFQSIEVKNQQLQSVQRRLLQNPQDRQALSVILNLLEDKDTVARANAATILGDLGEKIGPSIKERAIPSLVGALDKDNAFVKKSAACALGKFGPLAKDAVPVLKKNLTPSDSDVAWCAAEALGAIGELAREAVPDLLKVIKDSQSQYSFDRTNISEFALKALGEIGPVAKEVVPDLVLLLDHQSPYFRVLVSVALIRIDPSNLKVREVLRSLLTNQDVDVRRKTIWTLKNIGMGAKPVKQLVEAAAKDKDADVNVAAIQLLEVINN
jgi:HEAT repeat protein